MPRDIEAACGELQAVSLYDIDDLQAVVARNLSSREQAPRVGVSRRRSIASPAGSFQLDTLPTVSALAKQGKRPRRAGS